MAPSIRERIVDWITERPGETFTTNKIAVELQLQRAQAKRALHALANGGLANQLHNLGSAKWTYTPPITIRYDKQTLPEGGTAADKVPVGWLSLIRITCKFGDQGYIAEALTPTGKTTGKFLFINPIQGPIEVALTTMDIQNMSHAGETGTLVFDETYAQQYGGTYPLKHDGT